MIGIRFRILDRQKLHRMGVILSKDKLKRTLWAIDDYKRELSKLKSEHDTISKYKDRLWFWRVTFTDRETHLLRYHELAKQIEDYEAGLIELQTIVADHFNEIEKNHLSMNPFKGINLRETTLVQIEMF